MGKEDKQVKQHSYHTDEGLQYDNSSKRLSSQVEQRKDLHTYMDGILPSFLLILVCLPTSDIV